MPRFGFVANAGGTLTPGQKVTTTYDFTHRYSTNVKKKSKNIKQGSIWIHMFKRCSNKIGVKKFMTTTVQNEGRTEIYLLVGIFVSLFLALNWLEE